MGKRKERFPSQKQNRRPRKRFEKTRHRRQVSNTIPLAQHKQYYGVLLFLVICLFFDRQRNWKTLLVVGVIVCIQTNPRIGCHCGDGGYPTCVFFSLRRQLLRRPCTRFVILVRPANRWMVCRTAIVWMISRMVNGHSFCSFKVDAEKRNHSSNNQYQFHLVQPFVGLQRTVVIQGGACKTGFFQPKTPEINLIGYIWAK